MTTALGVSAVDNSGLTPLVHRLIIGSYFANPGVIDGLTVSGRNDLQYNVSAGCAVVQRAQSDGKMLAYYNGGTAGTYSVTNGSVVTSTVSAGDPTNPRIDVIWMRANNSGDYDGDPDNQVHVGVTQGTPAATPVKPAIPAGCLQLMAMLMPAGATSTQTCTKTESVEYTIPYGASLGKLNENWWRQDMQGDSTVKKFFYEMPVTFTVPTDRLIRLKFTVSLSAAGQPWESTARRTEWAICFQLDGQDVEHSGANFIAYGAWETKEHDFIIPVTAGTHTVRIRSWLQNGVAPYFHYLNDTNTAGGIGDLWVGRRFEVFDVGVAR